MIWKILGVVLAIWIVVALFGAVFKFLTFALVVGAIAFVGVAAYGALKRGRDKNALPR